MGWAVLPHCSLYSSGHVSFFYCKGQIPEQMNRWFWSTVDHWTTCKKGPLFWKSSVKPSNNESWSLIWASDAQRLCLLGELWHKCPYLWCQQLPGYECLCTAWTLSGLIKRNTESVWKLPFWIFKTMKNIPFMWGGLPLRETQATPVLLFPQWEKAAIQLSITMSSSCSMRMLCSGPCFQPRQCQVTERSEEPECLASASLGSGHPDVHLPI